MQLRCYATMCEAASLADATDRPATEPQGRCCLRSHLSEHSNNRRPRPGFSANLPKSSIHGQSGRRVVNGGRPLASRVDSQGPAPGVVVLERSTIRGAIDQRDAAPGGVEEGRRPVAQSVLHGDGPPGRVVGRDARVPFGVLGPESAWMFPDYSPD